MSVNDLKILLKNEFNLMIILALFTWGLAFYQNRKVKLFAIKWIFYVLAGMALLYIMEWLIIHYFITDSFIFFEQAKFLFSNVLGLHNTNFFSSFHYLIKFIFLSLFFRDLMKERRWQRFFQYLMVVLVVFELAQVFVFKSYQGYDSLSSTVKNVFILFGCGLFLYKFYNTPVGPIPLQRNTYYWVILGLFLPALTEFFLELIFTKLYQTDIAQFYRLYLVRNASQIVCFLLMMVCIWQSKYLKFLPTSY